MKEMRVGAIGIDSDTGEPMVLLQDKASRRALPIWIGLPEARAISLAVNKLKPGRPLTHNLMLSAINKLGYEVKEVVIDDIADAVFKATITLEGRNPLAKKPPLHLDSRPSDAVVLALLSGAPLLVAQRILAQAGIATDPETDEKEAKEFKDFLENIKASDFKAVSSGETGLIHIEDDTHTEDEGNTETQP